MFCELAFLTVMPKTTPDFWGKRKGPCGHAHGDTGLGENTKVLAGMTKTKPDVFTKALNGI